MISRINLILLMASFPFLTFHNCLYNDVLDGNQRFGDYLVVDLPEIEFANSDDDVNGGGGGSKIFDLPPERKSRRVTISSWSLSPNTSASASRMWLDWIVPISPLKNTSVNPGRSRRPQKRSILSLPVSSFKFRTQFVVPVLPLLNETRTYLLFDFPTTWKMPSSKQLNELYASFSGTGGGGGNAASSAVNDTFVDDRRANSDRRKIYKYIEGFFNNFGINGLACVKRAICEMSEAPLSSDGLFGEAVELILTPSLLEMPPELEPHFGPNRTRRNTDDPILEDILEDFDFLTAPLEDEYTEAYRRGKDGLCWSHYAACPMSIFKMVDLFIR